MEAQETINIGFAASPLKDCRLWDHGKVSNPSNTSKVESPEFEFNMGGLALDDLTSSADVLFHNGQLLPLHSQGLLHFSLSDMEEDDDQLVLERDIDTWRFVNPSSHLRSDTEDIKFASCRMNHVQVSTVAGSPRFTGSMELLRCSSFGSHGTGFWESTAEKDTVGESSSSRDSNGSSRDSNGSSQDSCFSHGDLRDDQFVNGGVRKASRSTGLRWKAVLGGLRKASEGWMLNSKPGRKHGHRVAFSEDLSKYRALDAASIVLPTRGPVSTCGTRKAGERQNHFHKMSSLQERKQEVGGDEDYHGYDMDDDVDDERKKLQMGSGAALKDRWRTICTRKLKPLYAKLSQLKGLEGRKGGLLMRSMEDSCGGGHACAVLEEGTDSSFQRSKLSHSHISPSSCGPADSHDNQSDHCKHADYSHGNHNTAASNVVSLGIHGNVAHARDITGSHGNHSDHSNSVDYSHASSPVCASKRGHVPHGRNHGDTDGNMAHGRHNASSCHGSIPSGISRSSVSTMQEMQSAIQGAIAHCKESITGMKHAKSCLTLSAGSSLS